jgi:hypothetical protein
MFRDFFTIGRALVFAAAVGAGGLATSASSALGQHGHGGPSTPVMPRPPGHAARLPGHLPQPSGRAPAVRGPHHGPHGGHGAVEIPLAPEPPHGGQLSFVPPHVFEVVYQPEQIRVYIHGLVQQPHAARGAHQPAVPGRAAWQTQPLSAQGVQGTIAMQSHNQRQVRRVPLEHVAPPPGSPDQDYLAAPLDHTHVQDGAMQVTVTLRNVPSAPQRRAAFSQIFTLTRPEAPRPVGMHRGH